MFPALLPSSLVRNQEGKVWPRLLNPRRPLLAQKQKSLLNQEAFDAFARLLANMFGLFVDGPRGHIYK
jgi:hypothetical protein